MFFILVLLPVWSSLFNTVQRIQSCCSALAPIFRLQPTFWFFLFGPSFFFYPLGTAENPNEGASVSGWTVVSQLPNYQNIPSRLQPNRQCCDFNVKWWCNQRNPLLIKPLDFNRDVPGRLGPRPFEWFLWGSSRPEFKHLAGPGEIQLDLVPAAVGCGRRIWNAGVQEGSAFLQEAEGGCWNASGYRPLSNKTDIPTRVMKR